jgi:hypothetical protein
MSVSSKIKSLLGFTELYELLGEQSIESEVRRIKMFAYIHDPLFPPPGPTRHAS